MDMTPAENCDKSSYFTPTLLPFFLFLFALPHCAASVLLSDPPSLAQPVHHPHYLRSSPFSRQDPVV